MSPSSEHQAVPPEVLAIAVAMAAEWQAAEAAAGRDAGREPPKQWRWAGRRWDRPTGHRWS